MKTTYNNILYVSSLCSERTEKALFEKKKEAIGFQAMKYHRLLVKGLQKCTSVTCLSYHLGTEIISIEPEEQDDYRIHYSNIIINNKLIPRYIQIMAKSFAKTTKFLSDNPGSAVICDVLNIMVSRGALMAAKLHRAPRIGIITDFPEFIAKKAGLFTKMAWKNINLCTGYVVLTEQMKEKLQTHKPIIVLEGHVDSEANRLKNNLNDKYQKKVCIYAGLIHKKYGIEKLVNAFAGLNRNDAELHIYGDGDYAEELKIRHDGNIKYFGLVSNEHIIEEETRATLLINPRPTDEEYTQYSFPSKNMEYMVSGTPVLTTRLPGMPEEYLDYVFTFDDESIDGMRDRINDVLNHSREELHNMGMKASSYVIKHKTNTIQAQKIFSFINHNFSDIS